MENKINVYIFIYTNESQGKERKKEIIFLCINIYYEKIVIYIFKYNKQKHITDCLYIYIYLFIFM